LLNASARYEFAKRILDVAGALIALIFSAPIFIIASLLIKLDGGPVFFRQVRVGRHGRTFRMLKLRTMVPNAHKMELDLRKNIPENEGYGNVRKFHDPRITLAGRALRFTNLDELPQFINILKGDMSIVGPRPVPLEESYFYGDKRDAVLSVRPGLTGYWQIKRRMSTNYEERIRLDCIYVKKMNLKLDAYILLMTPISMLTSDYNSVTKSLPPAPTLVDSGTVTTLAKQSTNAKLDETIKDAAA